MKVWRNSPETIRILLVSSFLMNVGFYALIPYLTLYLTGDFAWSMAMAGILLGIRQFSQQGFSFLGGLVADRIGCKETLVAGVLVRAAGFLSFAFCHSIWQFVIAAILSGLGGALFEPAFQAAFARLTPEEGRQEIFAFRSVVINMGIVFSTLVGSLLSGVDFFYLSLLSGILFVLVAALVWVGLPWIKIEVTGKSWMQDIHTIVKDTPFITYTIILIGYYYLYMQLFLTIPRIVEEITGGRGGVALIYATISITVIVFQLKVTSLLQPVSHRFSLIGFGSLFMGIGLLLLGFVTTTTGIIAAGILFSLGTMITGPAVLDIVTVLAPKELIGSYYGFNAFSLAIGGALSTGLGGWLYDAGLRIQWPLLPWVSCFIVSLLVCWRMYRLDIRTGLYAQVNE
jgi:MFS transporter, DHA1 family, multidrug resistance protein